MLLQNDSFSGRIIVWWYRVQNKTIWIQSANRYTRAYAKILVWKFAAHINIPVFEFVERYDINMKFH